jgi:hypothetical protein
VLIPEVLEAHPWQRVLHNQRGFVLEQAIQRGTQNVVICRLRYRLSTVAGGGSADDGAQALTGPELPPVNPPPGQQRPK